MTRPQWFLAIVLSVILSGSPAAMAAFNTNDVILLLANSKRLQLNSPNSSLRQAMASFLENFSGNNRVALLAFDEHTSLVFPLTPLAQQEAETLLKPLNNIQPGRRYSNSAAALERAIEELYRDGRREASKVIVFITDKHIDTGDETLDLQFTRWLRELLSEQAAAAGIRVYGIAYSATADVQSIEALTTKTGGHYERVSGTGELQAAFNTLSTTITHQQRSVEPWKLTSISPTLFNPEMLPYAKTTTVTAQQEFNSAIEAQPPETTPQRVEIPPLTQSDRHETQSDQTGIQKLMPELPTINQMTAWIASNKIFLTAITATFVVIILGMFLVLRHRKRSAISSNLQHLIGDNVPSAHLEDIGGITNQGVYDISSKLTRIRRAPTQESNTIKTIVISDHLISRDHAIIEYENSGYWISDQNSANGTFVNDEKVIGKKLLKDGDHIRFAKYDFKFIMPPLPAMSATVALTPISEETHSAQGDEATLATVRPPLTKGGEVPQPWYREEHRPRVGTPNLNPPNQQNYEPTAAGSTNRPTETTESRTISPDKIQKARVKDLERDTSAASLASDDQGPESETDYVSGGTDKLPGYHQGDTIMFSRSGGKKVGDRVSQVNEPPINLGETNTSESVGEVSDKAEYPRGGTELYRPAREALTEFGNFPNQPESESNQMNVGGEETTEDKRTAPQIGPSDTIAISPEQMRQILRHKRNQTKTHVESTEITRDDSDQACKKPSKSDRVNAALSSDGDSERRMTMDQVQDEAQYERNTQRNGWNTTEEGQHAQHNRGDTVAISRDEIEKIITSAHSRNETPNASTNTSILPEKYTEEGTEKNTESEHSELKYSREKSAFFAPEQPQPTKSDDSTPQDTVESPLEEQAQHARSDTVVIPHEEIERMIQQAQREDKKPNTFNRNSSVDIDDGITKLSEVDHDRSNTEELELDQSNENAASTTHTTQNKSPGVASDISLNANQTETKISYSPSSTNAHQKHQQGDSDQTRAVSSSTDDVDKTVVISTERRHVDLAPNGHQTHPDREEDDETTKERPFRGDR